MPYHRANIKQPYFSGRGGAVMRKRGGYRSTKQQLQEFPEEHFDYEERSTMGRPSRKVSQSRLGKIMKFLG